ncbi:fam-g protein [Plasmodium gallinaceum]|uniref:Fam-g protein n=1 Tax=Plasmodium gallinaceum TaxID=5849 RepID=A0A1J1GVZ5_PLAGA|nr:fam-g protein [Plasmodium gallinaceum]CRG95467.1 fam-g protein [Plasmodium gallinaceum]
MKTLTLYLKITTFLILIWIYQCFYNYDSYKTLIDKNRLQIKYELKYERVLTEGDIAGEKQTKVDGCQEECPVEKKKKEKKRKNWFITLVCHNTYDQWQRDTNEALFERFKNVTSEMDPKWRDQKWNNEWNEISANKFKEVSSIFHRSDVSKEEKKKLILDVKNELYILFVKFSEECKKEMRKNETKSESKKEMIDNKTDSESKKEIIDNKTDSESMKEMIDNKTDSESKKEMIENKTDSESKKEMIDNKTDSESMKDMIDNKTESESKNVIRDNISEPESMKEMRENRTESESKNEMRGNKRESESTKEQGKNKIKNEKSNIWKFLFNRFDNH